MFQKLAITMSLPVLLSASGDVTRISGPHPADRENPAYLTLETFELPIFDSGRIDGHVSAKIVIEGQDRDAMPLLREQLPKIRATLFAAMIEFNRLHVSGLAPIDAELLSQQLNDHGMTPDTGIRRILIVELSSVPT